MSSKKTVYHYTTQKNADSIRKTGVIHPSVTGAHGGNKVYFTTLKPSSGKAAIARNNYDDRGAYWEGRESKGSVDAVVKVKLPASKLQKASDPLGRNIYTHNGPVKLPGSKKK
ncbi:uncharacterized protein LOC143283650 [Babylonia areolata]|uniref:uncharacterized protein LOC143283650 n=1 Tax=Babylonia areolata TaxID=304850 RepID=UPI003FD4F6AD